jgi:hypothetical protein
MHLSAVITLPIRRPPPIVERGVRLHGSRPRSCRRQAHIVLAAAFSHRIRNADRDASIGPLGSPVFARARKTDPPSRLILPQTSAGNFDRVASSLAPHIAQFLLCVDKKPSIQALIDDVSGLTQKRRPDFSRPVHR